MIEEGKIYERAKVEEYGKCFGIPYCILFTMSGYRTAYIDVINTRFEFCDYCSIDRYFDVHGGLTYSSTRLPVETEETVQLTNHSWIGWDYAHYTDGNDIDLAMKIFGWTPHIMVGHIYSLDEVRSDVISMCKQLIKESEE